MSGRTEVAVLAGGCFWCMEALFLELRGIISVESGFSGGRVQNPTYAQVCTGTTGHAEAVRITYNPEEISYKQILRVFFTMHDPTTPNRQGADRGTQYRSMIFYSGAGQKKAAEEVKMEFETAGIWGRPIVTEVAPLGEFYKAESYHRDYYRNNPLQPYCMLVIRPKVAKLRKQYADMLRRR